MNIDEYKRTRKIFDFLIACELGAKSLASATPSKRK